MSDPKHSPRVQDVRLDDDPALNMTPMIDIVFQLIVFFLLTLRFSPPAWRLEASMPQHLGLVSSAPVDDVRPVSVSLFRRGDADRSVTRVKIGGGEAIELGRTDAERAASLERVHDAVVDLIRRTGGTRAEMRAPPPTGPLVPHGDVVAVLDQLIRADLRDIAFQGTSQLTYP